MTLPPELELGLGVVVDSPPLTAVTTLGDETVVPAATDVTTVGVFVVDVTLGDVDETTIGVVAVVAPPDAEIRGMLKAGQPSSNSFKTRQKRNSRKR